MLSILIHDGKIKHNHWYSFRIQLLVFKKETEGGRERDKREGRKKGRKEEGRAEEGRERERKKKIQGQQQHTNKTI